MKQEFKDRLEQICLEYSNQRFQLRPLQEQDYNKGYFNLLDQFSDASIVDEELFKRQLKELEQRNNPHIILVIEDLQFDKIAAQGTILIEQKFVRNLGRVGHIENLVVDKFYRKNNLGLIIVEALQRIAFQADNCYKVTVNPMTRNIPFYKKLQFNVIENHMMLLISQFISNPKRKAFIKPKL